MSERTIELIYDPFALTTAQHRAGLAGLLVLVESLRKRKMKPVPEIHTNENQTISVRITEDSLTVLFNELYDAIWDERKSDSKPQAKTVRNVKIVEEDAAADNTNGRKRRKKQFVYETIAPKAKFLEVLGLTAPWIKLWREAIFGSIRSRDKQRQDYKDRAQGKPASSVAQIWAEIERLAKAKGNNKSLSVELSSSLFIGGQDTNAEKVSFLGGPDHNLLLHFWPVVMGVYVPEIIDRDGTSKLSSSYVLVIPDVTDPIGFVQDFLETLARLGTEMTGYRPKQAVITLPQEGGLEYLHHLLGLVKAKTDVANAAGVEVYHLEKRGNNVHMLSTDRVPVSRRVLEQYEAIRDKYYSVLFRRKLILNLIRGEPWYREFDRVFAKGSKEWFIGIKAHRFSSDVQRRFEVESQARRSA
ncbi:MAG: hypothetical protein A4E19_02210 [Nitrospira sp. SG-bin1]|nr:MAG: hypothetical protein A4E19_02210 [Nitrospira sp. SG-bin1]